MLNPAGAVGPRLAIDYSRLEIRDEIVAVRWPLQAVIDDEDLYPEWVDREPLSAADAALGYTAGRITKLYSGFGNAGRTVTETIDLQLDWALPANRWGETSVYGAATWQPRLRSKLRRDGAWIDRTGYRDSALEWRGNARDSWRRNDLTIDLNLQYFGGYNLAYSGYAIQSAVLQREVPRVRAHTYVDLVARRRFDMRADSALRSLDVRLAVQNLLDASPPVVADVQTMGYDYRGDPRGRRVELLLTARF